MKKILFFIIALAISVTNIAAQTSVTFDTSDYKSVGVYDTWENSPFRNGTLTGNAAVVANHLNGVDEAIGYAPNTSANILGVQRSRYGSNTFGARIDLNNTFELTTTTRYVHVLIYKPVEGRVMLVGLGRRTERTAQSKDTEQFWVFSSSKVEAGKWCDAVFPIKGAGGIDIYSLVVIPDCESPHALSSDFVAYIDDIEINSDNNPRVSRTPYPLNIEENTKQTRTDRYTKSVMLGTQSFTVASSASTNNPVYTNLLSQQFKAKAGETLTPKIGFTGSWMHGYIYLDYGQDGKFSVDLNSSGVPTATSDLVSYNYYDGKNSKGTTISESNLVSNSTITGPTFTLPSSMTPGRYRMRYIVDWNSVDPGGNIDSSNHIVNNGGSITDIVLNVHEDNVSVNTASRNGEVLAEDGSKLSNYSVPFNTAFTIRMNPENGFKHDGVIIRHGYNLDGDKELFGTPQWEEVVVPRSAFSNGKYTVPASYVDGNILIEGVFIEKVPTDYPINVDDDAAFSRSDRGLTAIGLGTQSATVVSSISSSDPVYTNLTAHQFQAKAGQTVTPTFTYTGSAMYGYVYVDYGMDGQFEYGLNADGTPAEGSDIVAYSYYDGKNSSGTTVTTSAALNPPSFTVPAGTSDGFYMMRYKVDYDNVDPGGRVDDNNIVDNRGGIADIRLNVHGDNVSVSDISDDGDVFASDGTPLVSYTAPFGEALTVKVVPEAGYSCTAVNVRHGHNLSGDQYIHGVEQWTTTVLPSSSISDGRLTIPAEYVDGDIEIEGVFVEGEDTSPITRSEKLSDLPTVSGWYQISDTGGSQYVKNSAETTVSGQGYALTKTTSALDVSDASGYVYVEKDGDDYKFQSANGHYLDKAASTLTPTAMSSFEFAEGAITSWTPTFTITMNSGTCTNYNNETVTNTTSYFKTWTSNTSTPTLLLYQGTKGAAAGNNMQRQSAGLYLYANNTATEYTLEVPSNYKIIGYKIVFKSITSYRYIFSTRYYDMTVTPASGGSSQTTGTSNATKTVSVSGLSSNIAKFTVKNNYNTSTAPIQATTFEVYVEPNGSAEPSIKLPWEMSGSTVVNSSSQSDWNMYKMNNVEGNYDVYKVNIVGAPDASASVSDKARATYPSVTSGLTSVYDGGYFFVEKNKRIATSEIVGTEYSGYISDAAVDENAKTITVSYREYTAPTDDEAVSAVVFASSANPAIGSSNPSCRIPAITRTSEGSLLAVGDRRYHLDDIGSTSGSTVSKIELLFSHSTDEGATWTANQVLSTNSTSTSAWNYATGDAALIADRESGNVLVYCASGSVGMGSSTASNPIKVGCFRSSDNGHTWDSGTDVTSQMYGLYNGNATAMFITSGRMLQSQYVKVGDYYRIYAAFPVRTSNQGNGTGVMYSDDFGYTWKLLGGTTLPKGSVYEEGHVSELPDGSIVLIVRDDNGRSNDSNATTLTKGHKNFNIYTFTNSETGAGYWSTAASGITGMNNATNNQLLFVPAVRNSDNKQLYVAILAMPTHTIGTQSSANNYGRKDMYFFYKEIEDANDYVTGEALAEGWAKGLQVTDKFSAYSDLLMLNNNYIGLFYEDNGRHGTGLSGNQQVECYDLTFSSYSLERITNGHYSVAPEFTDRTGYFDSSLEVRVGGKVGKAVGMIGEEYPYINDKTQENMEEMIKDNYEGTLKTNVLVENRPYYIRSTQTNFGGVEKGTVLLGTDRSTLIPVARENGTISEVFSFQSAGDGAWKLYSLNNEVWAQSTPADATTPEAVSENESDAESFTLKINNDGWSAIVSQNPGATKQGGINCADGTVISGSRTSKTANATAYWYIEPLEEWTIKMNKVSTESTESYATLYLPFTTELPENTKAYVVGTLGSDMAETVEVDEIPALTPVLLVNTLGETSVTFMVPASQAEALNMENELSGELRDKPITDRSNLYIFSRSNGKAGFFHPSASVTKLSGNKAYIVTDNGSSRGFQLSFNGAATALEEIFSATVADDNGKYYDLTGRRVVQPQKGGVYILNGRKILVK